MSQRHSLPASMLSCVNKKQFRYPLKVSLVDTGIRVCPMSDVCHNLLELHTNVKQDTVAASREGESQESRDLRFSWISELRTLKFQRNLL